MERAEQIKFCEKCTNRDYSPQQGIICKLTGNQASFTDTCESYQEDAKAAEVVKNESQAKENAEIHDATFGLSIIGIKNGVLAGGIVTGLGIISIFFTVIMFGVLSFWSILIIIVGIIAMVKGASSNKTKKKRKIEDNGDLLDS